MRTLTTPADLASHLLETLFGGEQPDESISVLDAVRMAGGIQYPVEIDSAEYIRIRYSVWSDVSDGAQWPF